MMTEQYLNLNAKHIKYTEKAYFLSIKYEESKLKLWIPKQLIKKFNHEILIHSIVLKRIKNLIQLKEDCKSKRILIDADIGNNINLTEYHGVSLTKNQNKWRVSIGGNYLGTYDNILEASYVAKKFEKEFFNIE